MSVAAEHPSSVAPVGAIWSGWAAAQQQHGSRRGRVHQARADEDVMDWLGQQRECEESRGGLQPNPSDTIAASHVIQAPSCAGKSTSVAAASVCEALASGPDKRIRATARVAPPALAFVLSAESRDTARNPNASYRVFLLRTRWVCWRTDQGGFGKPVRGNREGAPGRARV